MAVELGITEAINKIDKDKGNITFWEKKPMCEFYKFVRKEIADISQKELAKKIGYAEEDTIRRWETEKDYRIGDVVDRFVASCIVMKLDYEISILLLKKGGVILMDSPIEQMYDAFLRLSKKFSLYDCNIELEKREMKKFKTEDDLEK